LAFIAAGLLIFYLLVVEETATAEGGSRWGLKMPPLQNDSGTNAPAWRAAGCSASSR